MSIITITEVGTIRADFWTSAIDYAGIFGPRGASLVGQHFTAVITGSDCNCVGGVSGSNVYGVNPVQDATLTINDITYDFGPGLYGNMLLTGAGLFQVNTATGLMAVTGGPLGTGGGGSFAIASTNGSFLGESISNSLNVPGPVVGADLPGLLVAMLIIFGGFYWKRRVITRNEAID